MGARVNADTLPQLRAQSAEALAMGNWLENEMSYHGERMPNGCMSRCKHVELSTGEADEF
jgi:hypothetical protein